MFQIAYPDTDKEMIVEIGDGWIKWVPSNPANSDYQQYLAWLEEGNTPEEWINE
jgi:hypothetical protein